MNLKSTLILKDSRSVIYLDHQIWCGMAESDSKYLELRNVMERVAGLQNIIFPYSLVHIRELTEMGKASQLSRTERIKKVAVKLNFIKAITKSVLLEADEKYSRFKFETRDPIEAFNAFTEVEIDGTSTETFTNLIPKIIVQEIQKHFNLGAEKLNNMSEENAICAINLGFKNFIDKCQSDRKFLRLYIDNAKKEVEIIFRKLHSQTLASIKQTTEMAVAGYKVEGITITEKAALDSLIAHFELQRSELENTLESKIQAAQESCEKSVEGQLQLYTFEVFLDQIVQSNKTSTLPMSFFKTLLLDFFGYNSKLNNRRSDYYDALHKEYAKVCDWFVTDDDRLQQKLGKLDSLIAGTECRLLSSQGLCEKLAEVFDNTI